MANVLNKVTDTCWRLKHDAILGAGSFTVTFDDATIPGDFVLVAPTWQPYREPESPESSIDHSLVDVVQVDVIIAGGGVVTTVPFAVEKSGSTHADFLITITNTTALEGGTTSPAMEFYFTFGGH